MQQVDILISILIGLDSYLLLLMVSLLAITMYCYYIIIISFGVGKTTEVLQKTTHN